MLDQNKCAAGNIDLWVLTMSQGYDGDKGLVTFGILRKPLVSGVASLACSACPRSCSRQTVCPFTGEVRDSETV